MEGTIIRPMAEEYQDYLRDESRSVGRAESISFPTSTEQVAEILVWAQKRGIQVTVQGGRTGLAAAAVPQGGHIMNLTRMNRVLGCRQDATGKFTLLVEPGLPLAQLRRMLAGKKFNTGGWDAPSLEAYTALCRGQEQFFSPDPTEASATLGGMVNCNASGARSFAYGPVRPYIKSLEIVLMGGRVVKLQRGQQLAQGRKAILTTQAGERIPLDLPTFSMPQTKNASGYYAADDMDLIDLFIGADGTLGVVTQIEICLLPLPQLIWGVTGFFASEELAMDYVRLARGETLAGHSQPSCKPCALEYFDGDALEILRQQRLQGGVFAQIHPIPTQYKAAVYAELHGQEEEGMTRRLLALGAAMEQAGGSEADTWVARSQRELESLQFFRHAIPECVNRLIDVRKQKDSAITKLGTDMAVPDDCLGRVVALYRKMLGEYGLQSAVWGHVGDNHLHVNILPNSREEYDKGKELYKHWAAEVTAMGGAVSAEHGVGKLKAEFLEVMYGPQQIGQMRQLKKALDPGGLLNRNNLFSWQEVAQ